MLLDVWYWVAIGIGTLAGMWAQAKVKGAFAKYSQFTTRSGLTGADVARKILQQYNIHDVTVEPVPGALSDHYDPRTKTLRLSEPVYASRSMAAFGIAAHEVGHAIQHAENYGALKFRSAWVPVAGLGGKISMFVIIASLLLGGMATVGSLSWLLGWVGLALFATTTIFTLVTLPVEFDASKRAIYALDQGGFTTGEELQGAKKVLDAAAMTYVAAALASFVQLLYWASLLLGGRRD